MLDHEQKQALAWVEDGTSTFVTGGAGTGKSFLLSHVPRDGTAFTASTGIAALNISGLTLHSWLGVGIEKDVDRAVEKLSTVHWLEPHRKRIRATQRLVVDEVSMLDGETLTVLDHCLRAVRGSQEPFGGVQMIFVGDFLQLPPVQGSMAFESDSWKGLDPKISNLTIAHRQDDEGFLSALGRIRTGDFEGADIALLRNCNKLIPNAPTLHTHRNGVDHLNATELSQLPSPSHVYDSKDGGRGIDKYCPVPAHLELKVGARVMCVKNMGNLVNGMLGTVIAVGEDVRVAFNRGGVTSIPPARWELTDTLTGEVVAWREQLPLTLAWALTIHKAQGLSLDSASIYTRKCFSPGQCYVALSRVRSLGGLHLPDLQPHHIHTNKKAKEYYDKS